MAIIPYHDSVTDVRWTSEQTQVFDSDETLRTNVPNGKYFTCIIMDLDFFKVI